MPDELALNCLLQGEDEPITVTASKSSSITGLKQLVWRELSDTLAGVPTYTLKLWKLSEPVSAEKLEAFANDLPKKDITQIATKLIAFNSVSDYFPSQPDEEHLHIVATLPQRGVKRKHSPSPSPEDETAYRLKKLALLPGKAPPSLAQPEEFEATGRKIDLFDFNRPSRPGSIPVTLLHPVFGQFVDDSLNSTLTSDDYEFAWELREEMSKYFKRENERAQAFSNLIKAYTDIPLQAVFLPSSNNYTDGDYRINEYCIAGVYYAHFVKALGDRIRGSVLPCLTVFYAGPFIGFAGAAFTDFLRQDVLTTVQPLVWEPHDEFLPTQVARAFHAFRNAAECLKQYYTHELPAIQRLDHSQLPSTRYPYPTKYRPLATAVGAVEVNFVYTDVIQKTNLVFKGRTTDGDEIVIKFTRRYSKEVHLWCAAHGYAPTLLGVEHLPGGWIMIVMDLLDADAYAGLDDIWTKLRRGQVQGVRTKVDELVHSLHTAGYVHGDLRDTNFLVALRENGDMDVRLVDYDWAGLAGQAQYPPLINRKTVRRPAGAVSGKAIEKEHDVEMVTFMFQDTLQ